MRQKRIAAIRATEALAIISYDDYMEYAEWHDTADLDVTGIEYISSETLGKENNVLSLENCLLNEWAATYK